MTKSQQRERSWSVSARLLRAVDQVETALDGADSAVAEMVAANGGDLYQTNLALIDSFCSQ